MFLQKSVLAYETTWHVIPQDLGMCLFACQLE